MVHEESKVLTVLLLACQRIALLRNNLLVSSYRRRRCWSVLGDRHSARIYYCAIILGDIFGNRDFWHVYDRC